MYKDMDERTGCHRTKKGQDGKAAEADEKKNEQIMSICFLCWQRLRTVMKSTGCLSC